MILPILPDTMDVPLDDAGFPGVVAVVRPLDVHEKSALYYETRALPDDDGLARAVATAKRQLVALRGVQMQNAAGESVPFDPANDAHFRSMPFGMMIAIANALTSRASLPEALAGN